MTSTPSAGSTMHISAALPATPDKTGYAALTYTKIGGLQSIGAFGATTAVVNFQPLEGPEEKHKGATNFGSLNPPIAHDKADAGQTLLRTASEPENNALYSFKVILANGDKRYFQARVFGYPETVGEATTVLMANPTIEVNTKVIKDDVA